MNKQRMVQDFMEAINQEVPGSLNTPSPDIRKLRVDLIQEELEEFASASGVDLVDGSTATDEDYTYMSVALRPSIPLADIAKVADAIGDLLYVVYGAAVAWGIQIDPVFGAIHQANMLKLTGPKRADGKQLKPSDWQAPDIKGILDAQMA